MDLLHAVAAETDARFPSGPWTGFWLQCWAPGRHMMTIDLNFLDGQMRAKGSDIATLVGEHLPVRPRRQAYWRYCQANQKAPGPTESPRDSESARRPE